MKRHHTPWPAWRLVMVGLLGIGAASADVVQRGQAEMQAELLRGAQMWSDKGRPDLARQLITKLLAMDPDSPEAQAFLADLLLRENKLADAGKILDTLHDRYPQHSATRDLRQLVRIYGQHREQLARMRLMARAGRKAEAAAIAAELFPDGPPALGGLGIEYYQIMGTNPRSSGDARQRLERLYRETGDTRYRLAQLDLQLGQGGAMTRVLRELDTLSRQPGVNQQAVTDLWRRALKQLDDSPRSIPWAQAFLRQVPNDPAMTARLATLQLAAQRNERLARDPVNVARRSARQAMEQDQLEQAEAQWRVVLASRPRDGESLGNLGLIRLRQGRHDEAQDLLERANQTDPQQKWQDLSLTARFWGLLRQADGAVQQKQLPAAAGYAREALAIDPEQTQALNTLAQIHVLQDQPDLAQPLFEKTLRLAPGNSSALRGLSALHAKAGRTELAQALLEQASLRDVSLSDPLAGIRSELLREQAQTHLAAQRLSPALRLFEAAVLIAPDNAWLRHDLARLYLRLDLPAPARSVMREGVARAPAMLEMRYASALVRSALDDDAGALADLQQIPADQRTAGISALLQRVSVNLLVTQALTESDTIEADARLLQSAEKLAGNQAELLLTVANAWFRLEQPDQGVDVFNRLLTRQPDASLQTQLDHAQLRNRAGDDGALADQLPALLTQTGWTPEQQSRLVDLYTEYQERVIAQRVVVGQNTEAARLAALPLPPQSGQDQPRIAAQRQKAQARLLVAAAEPSRAIVLLQKALREVPEDLDMRLDLGNALYQTGQVIPALEQARWLEAHIPVADLNRRLALLRLFQRCGSLEVAWAEAQRLLARLPDNIDVLLHAARLERSMGRYGDALTFFQQALQRELASAAAVSKNATHATSTPQTTDAFDALPLRLAYSLSTFNASANSASTVISDGPPEGLPGAMAPMRLSDSLEPGLPAWRLRGAKPAALTTALARIQSDIRTIEARRQAWVEMGHETLQKSSTDGISTLRGTEQTVVAWLPWDYAGRVFLHLDPVRLDAGPLPLTGDDALRFGQVAARPPENYAPATYLQSARGINVGVGFEGDSLSWDIGKIGVGFPVSNLVGGISKSGEWERYNYNVGLSRRPLTGSLLSYAGTTDPASGEVWGGVVATGINARVSTDVGPYSVSTSAGYALLSGRNVMDNTRLQWRAAVDRDVLRSSSQVVNLGLSLSLLRHARDVSEFTWGHGGYYSPGNSVSLTLPLQWSGREGLFSWQVRGALSASSSSSDAMDRFPTQSSLQAAAGNPVYASSSSSGFGRSFNGVVEYQATQHLAIGARFQRDLSEDYAPLNLLLYARYLFDPVLAPLPARPRPPQAYSKF